MTRISFPLRLQPCLVRPLINRSAVLVLAKCETDKSEHHQDGSGYHQPMRILHRGEHRLFPLRLQFRYWLDVRPMQGHRTLHSVELNANDIRAEVSVSCSHDLSSFRWRSLHSAFAKFAKTDRVARLKSHLPFTFSPGRVRLQDIFSRLARLLTATTDRFNFTETR